MAYTMIPEKRTIPMKMRLGRYHPYSGRRIPDRRPKGSTAVTAAVTSRVCRRDFPRGDRRQARKQARIAHAMRRTM